VRIIEPTRHGNSIVGMEDVGRGGVVDNDGLSDGPAELRQVLDIVALVVITRLAEKSMLDDSVDV